MYDKIPADEKKFRTHWIKMIDVEFNGRFHPLHNFLMKRYDMNTIGYELAYRIFYDDRVNVERCKMIPFKDIAEILNESFKSWRITYNGEKLYGSINVENLIHYNPTKDAVESCVSDNRCDVFYVILAEDDMALKRHYSKKDANEELERLSKKENKSFYLLKTKSKSEIVSTVSLKEI